MKIKTLTLSVAVALVIGSTAGCAGPKPSPAPSSSRSTPQALFPPAGVAWAQLTWRKLAATDPLATFESVVRTTAGFIAIAAPQSTQSGFRTAVWTSAHGDSWQALNATAVGADTVVVGIYEVSGTVVALTMAGGAEPCDQSAGNCLKVQPPLRTWTSTDGLSWTFRSQPLTLELAPDTGLLEDSPRAAATADRMLIAQGRAPLQIVSSTDGLTWATVTPVGLPADFRGGLAGVAGGGFVLSGSSGGDNPKPVVAWSADGSTWEAATLPISSRTVGSAAAFAVAGNGMIINVTTDVVPGGPGWWSSTTGRDWQPVQNFAPLGVWNGEGEGSGGQPNGQLVADGERMIAYDTVTGTKAWTSFDGVTWTEVALEGDRPPATNGFPETTASQLSLTAIGLFWRDDHGNVWLGSPAS